MTNKAHNLQQLIALSDTMLQKAREQAWDELFELEQQRREVMQLFFLQGVAAADARAVAAGIELIMARDRDLMDLATATRDELAQTLQKMDQGKKAVKAYTS